MLIHLIILKVITKHSVFRHVSVATAIIIRGSSPCKLEHHHYTSLHRSVGEGSPPSAIS
jgi:hypothetical protein